MSETENGARHAKLRVTQEEARQLANLLRYAVSLNTTAGLVSPTQRRLATSTYRAVELAAHVLEGKTFEDSVEEAEGAWSGSLEQDHLRAIELLESTRDELRQTMAGRLSPEQTAQFLEVTQEQFLELLAIRPDNGK